jgi:hypothetical protein
LTELQRIPDNTPISDAWESCISEWETGVSQELMGALRQMRAAYYVREEFKREGVDKFALAVHARKSKVYAYAACFEALAEAYGDGVSGRVESSPLTPWQLVAGVKRGVEEAERSGEDIAICVEASLDRAEQGETVREINSTNSQVNVETVEKLGCPHCGGVFAMNEATQWTEAV